MITVYLHEAMSRAKYKILEDGSYYGWIEELHSHYFVKTGSGKGKGYGSYSILCA